MFIHSFIHSFVCRSLLGFEGDGAFEGLARRGEVAKAAEADGEEHARRAEVRLVGHGGVEALEGGRVVALGEKHQSEVVPHDPLQWTEGGVGGGVAALQGIPAASGEGMGAWRRV